MNILVINGNDGVGAAVRLAEALVALAAVKPRCGGYAPLAKRELVGVDPLIDALFGGS
jgi:hypothetical protein